MPDFVRPNIRAMAGYAPGEQPREDGFVKLNTNENPYPPSPRVFEAIHAALTSERLRKYPDPSGLHFRQAAGRVLGVDPDSILIGNGSDDILTIVTRACVPENGLIVAPMPSYLLYRSLAELQGAEFRNVAYLPDWSLPSAWPYPRANLTLVANPNSPSGTLVPYADLEHMAGNLEGLLLVDEAYVDFAEGNCLDLALRRNVMVTRTFSKFYSLAGVRFGYAVADPALVAELLKVKDSYNCDVLSLAAAAAAIEDQDYVRQIRSRILSTRERLETGLRQLGFEVQPSQANFVWCRRGQPVKRVYEGLKRRKVLVRYIDYPGYGDGLRVSVGTDAEIDFLFDELRAIG
jgi:histidinol-phosphate aminotransferase